MAKRQQDILDRVFASLSIRGILLHPTTMFFLATAIMIGGAIVLWENHQAKIVNLEEFRLTEDKIRVTPQPEWAITDIKKLVLRESESVNGSILDTKLVPRTAELMSNVGFIERIENIEKSKTGLDINVVYRHPVALVELSRVTLLKKWPAENQGKTVLLPVDRHGTLMPESIGESKNLPWIAVPYPSQFSSLTTWTAWPDQRIQDAAEISALFDRPLSEIGIQRIATRRFRQNKERLAEIPFELYSGSGTRIIWGNPPGKESQTESGVDGKIQALQALVAKYGPLDKVNLGPIDIRSGKPVEVGNSKIAEKPGPLFSDLK